MSDKNYCAIVGMGLTGFSCAKFLSSRNVKFCVMDTRDEPPLLQKFLEQSGEASVQTGKLEQQWLLEAQEIILSPGVPQSQPNVAEAIKRGVPVIGDVELFYRHAKAPVIAITGSNAKSTVTSLVAAMAAAAGIKVAAGGNLGTPALDLLADDVELYVLELSSFQLELLDTFRAQVAVFLNFSEDHLDRYHSVDEYRVAKQRIFKDCGIAIFNADDDVTQPQQAVKKLTSFTAHAPAGQQFGLLQLQGDTLISKGEQPLMSCKELALIGKHNVANALAALAIGDAMGWPMDVMLGVLRDFAGLPHRCQRVTEYQGVTYINDSKGTNVGATIAAIEGLGDGQHKNIILIAGGEGKGADFSPLKPVCEKSVKACVLIGCDANAIAQAVGGVCSILYAVDMASAVRTAADIAEAGDQVLLSPACASFDMFSNYEHRGECFVKAVEGLSL